MRWAWISLAISALVAVSPWGPAFLWQAFASNDQLGASIARPLVLMALAVAGLVTLGALLAGLWLRR